MKQIIETNNAPKALGAYSQAVKVGTTVYLSGQIALIPETMQLLTGDFSHQVQQVFKNLQAVCQAAGGDLADIVKLNIYVLDLSNFGIINDIMTQFFQPPYPARATVGVKTLPLGAEVEIEGIMELNK